MSDDRAASSPGPPDETPAPPGAPDAPADAADGAGHDGAGHDGADAADGAGHDGAPGAGGRRASLGRLRGALRPRASRGQVLAGLLCAALGYALVVQLQVAQSSGLDTLRETDLVRAVDDLGGQAQRLTGELTDLERTLAVLESEGDQREEALRSARQREDGLALLAGTAPATGPGVVVTIVDPGVTVTSSRLLFAVQELRDAGAEVISVGDVRVVASTSFTDSAAGPEADGTALASPITVLAIGDPARLEATIGIPGGAADVLETQGASVVVEASSEVLVTATAEVGDLDHLQAEDEPEPGR